MPAPLAKNPAKRCYAGGPDPGLARRQHPLGTQTLNAAGGKIRLGLFDKGKTDVPRSLREDQRAVACLGEAKDARIAKVRRGILGIG